jgi:glycerophosphoryl diester phosphodiesterase
VVAVNVLTANVAHRGASGLAPENTLASIRAAVATGADAVEVDVRRTRDGALVVLHDATLTRTTDIADRFRGRSRARVSDLTYDEVRALDAGSWHSPSYAGERVPLLAEVLDLLGGAGTGLLLEVKDPDAYPGIEADLVAELRSVRPYFSGALTGRQLVVESFDHRSMLRLKRLCPSVSVGLLGAPARRSLPSLAAWADQVNPQHRRLRRSYLDAVHDVGLDVQVWTVDGVAEMNRLVAMGVDGIITNRPDVLRGVLPRRVAQAA